MCVYSGWRCGRNRRFIGALLLYKGKKALSKGTRGDRARHRATKGGEAATARSAKDRRAAKNR